MLEQSTVPKPHQTTSNKQKQNSMEKKNNKQKNVDRNGRCLTPSHPILFSLLAPTTTNPFSPPPTPLSLVPPYSFLPPFSSLRLCSPFLLLLNKKKKSSLILEPSLISPFPFLSTMLIRRSFPSHGIMEMMGGKTRIHREGVKWIGIGRFDRQACRLSPCFLFPPSSAYFFPLLPFAFVLFVGHGMNLNNKTWRFV